MQELIAQKADGWVVTIYDPEAVQRCIAAGIGASVSLHVGGKLDAQHGPTLDISGRVRTLHDGTYEETERRHGGGRYFNQGLTAVVEVDRSGPGLGGLLVLNSRRGWVGDRFANGCAARLALCGALVFFSTLGIVKLL